MKYVGVYMPVWNQPCAELMMAKSTKCCHDVSGMNGRQQLVHTAICVLEHMYARIRLLTLLSTPHFVAHVAVYYCRIFLRQYFHIFVPMRRFTIVSFYVNVNMLFLQMWPSLDFWNGSITLSQWLTYMFPLFLWMNICRF